MSKLSNAQNSTTSDSHNGAAISIVLVLLALVSATVLSAYFSSPDAYAHQYEVLQDKRDNAAAMAAASTAASAVLSAIPDDTLIPTAMQLTSISRDLTVVLSAIMVQEWLLTTLGFLFFGIVMPACCVAFAIAAMLPQDSRVKAAILSGAVRILFAVAILWASVPCSVFLTDKIEETYASTVQSAIDAAEQVESLSIMDNEPEAEPKSVWASAGDFFYGLFHPVETINTAINSAAERAANLMDSAKAAYGSLVEGLTVLVVTTCVVPVLVPMLALWLARLALSPALSQLQRN